MNVLEKLERRIKNLKQEPLGFKPYLADECALLELAAARIRELENLATVAPYNKNYEFRPSPAGLAAWRELELRGQRD